MISKNAFKGNFLCNLDKTLISQLKLKLGKRQFLVIRAFEKTQIWYNFSRNRFSDSKKLKLRILSREIRKEVYYQSKFLPIF